MIVLNIKLKHGKHIFCYRATIINIRIVQNSTVILTNSPLSFQNSRVFETGTSGFHRMTLTVMKTFFHKLQLRIINYRSCRHFENHKFREGLFSKSCNTNIKSSIYKFSGFTNVCKQASDQYALSKEIMKRTRLRNKSLKKEVSKIKKSIQNNENTASHFLEM